MVMSSGTVLKNQTSVLIVTLCLESRSTAMIQGATRGMTGRIQ